MTTEPIDLSADLTQEVEEEEIDEVDSPARRPQRSTRRVAAAEAPAGNPGVTFALVVSALLLLFALALNWRTSNNERWRDSPLGDEGMFRKMSNLFYDMGSKEDVRKRIEDRSRALNQAYGSAVQLGGGETDSE